MSASYDDCLLGWYLRNVLSGPFGDKLTGVVRRHVFQVARPTDDPGETASADRNAEGKRSILLRYLGKFASRPEAADEGVLDRNLLLFAEVFALSPLDRDILRLAMEGQRFTIDRLCSSVQAALRDPPRSIAALLGANPRAVAQRLLRGAPLRGCGLIEYDRSASAMFSEGAGAVTIPPRILRALTADHADVAELSQDILGEPCAARLGWGDFEHLGANAELAASLLQASAGHGERGIHVLLAGPPGTGKTELAKTLAHHAGLTLFAAGEDLDEEGLEPSRAERSAALRLHLALLSNRRDCAVLLDEAEDVLDSTRSFGVNRSEFSKAFMHRMLERAPVPVIWTCNDTGWMEPATLRRMTLVLQVKVPDEAGRTRIWQRVLGHEGLPLPGDAAARLAARWNASAGLAASAARAARLAGGGETALEAALSGVSRVTGTKPPRRPRARVFDPELTACSEDPAVLARRLAEPDVPRNWSLCLSGPPGTGKTAFAHHLAGQIGLPVLQKRASDLLSMWVGGTEQQIAQAFAEAEEREALLLIDEAESLLFDRGAAVRAFEVSQVDELLTWMEQHPLPLVCTTNLPERMDHAVPRRFTFKLRFEPLDPARAMAAFRRILGGEPPGSLPAGLTPGDFDVVQRKATLLGENRPGKLLEWLEEEAAAKGELRGPLGFRPAPAAAVPTRRLSALPPAAAAQSPATDSSPASSNAR